MPSIPTFSGYLTGIAASDYTRSFDAAGLGRKLAVLPVSGFPTQDTLSGFLVHLATTPFVASGLQSALSAQGLAPGRNVPGAGSDEAGLIVVQALLTHAVQRFPAPPENLPRAILDRLQETTVQNGNTAYLVATVHIDTQWRWTVQDVIRSYVPATIDQNTALMDQYPSYVFSFEGAFRYMLAKEYFPDLYARMKQKIAEDRWRVAGGALVAGDVNMSSPESLIRQFLYANGFFRSELGKTSKDVFLPDCFGFAYSLPSIAAHCGRLGFSTQKLTWANRRDNFVPFDIGAWVGPDGATIVAALQPGAYVGNVPAGPLQDYGGDWPYTEGSYAETLDQKLQKIGDQTGLYAAYTYYGNGDQGGSPKGNSVPYVQASTPVLDPFQVKSAGSDQFFRDLSPRQLQAMKERLSYRGELLMSVHGTGSYTSETAMKRWERENELLATATEAAAAAADWLGGAAYPAAALRDAWLRFLWHQFHDDLTGTSMPDAYLISWNDEVLALNRFAAILGDATGALARDLDTRATGVPLVVYNPLSISRDDVVRAEVTFPGGAPKAVRVYDGGGKEVPSQAVPGSSSGALQVSFLASAAPVSFTVFDVRPAATPCDLPAGLKIDLKSLTLSSDRYTVTLDPGGDIRSIQDRQNGNRELVAAGQTLPWQMLYNGGPDDPEDYRGPNHWPAWQVMPYDVAQPPRENVGGTATITVYENGPVSVAFKVARTDGKSTFMQIVRLYAGGLAGRSVEVASEVDWRTDVTLLKAAFPLAVSNPQATYDLGLGTIQRGNNQTDNEPYKYEVPAQQWADLTDRSGGYGVAILNDCKYGWDKPADNTLRLTLIHTPYARNGYYPSPYPAQYYDAQRDFGPNVFRYAICGHPGDWVKGDIPWTAAAFNQRLVAFQTRSESGPLGRSFQFLSIDSSQVAVRAIKKAETWDSRPAQEVVLRLQELTGQKTGNVRITLGQGITAAREINGEEDAIGPATVQNNALVTELSAYQPRTFAVTLAPPGSPVPPPKSLPVDAGYNVNVVAPQGSFNASKTAFPAEQYPRSLTWSSVQFDLTPKGSHNARRCDGVPIPLPAGNANRVYLLAASTNGKKTVTFNVDGKAVPLTIQAITGTIGQWYDAGKRWMPKVGGSAKCGYDNYGNQPYQVPPTPPRIDRDPVAWYSTHLYQPGVQLRPIIPSCYYSKDDGKDYTRDVLPYEFGYMFLYSLDLAGTGPHKLTPPNDPEILLFAVSVAENPNADTVPAGVLYD